MEALTRLPLLQGLLFLIVTVVVGCNGLTIGNEERFARAEQAFDGGDYAAAVVDLKALLQADPDHLGGRLLLGQASLATGEFAGAEKEFQRAIVLIEGEGGPGAVAEAGPDDVAEMLDRAHLGLAASSMALQKFPEAYEAAGRVVAVHPDDLQARMLAAQAAYANRQDADAREHLEVVLEFRPAEPIANLLLGVVAIRGGNQAEGEAQFEKVLAVRPEDNGVRLMLTRVKMLLGKPVEALATFLPVLEQAPDDPRLLQVFEQIDLRAPEAAEGALTLADDLASQVPSSFLPDLVRARIHFLEGDHGSAAQLYDSAAARGAGRYAVLGEFLARRALGDVEAAEAVLSTWLEANDDDAVVRSVLASSHLGLGERGAAAAEYERLLEQSDRNPAVLNNLAWLYGEMGDERAVDLAREAHRLAPNNGAITDTLGWLLVQRGELNEGILLLRQALNQAPQNTQIREHLASALSTAGQQEEAGRILADVLGAEANAAAGPAGGAIAAGGAARAGSGDAVAPGDRDPPAAPNDPVE